MATNYQLRTVDVTGARRRLRALVRVGYPKSVLARHVGISEHAVEKILTAATCRVNPGTAAAVVRAYDELWDVAPDTSTARRAADAAHARQRAEAEGWPPPLAWDDDDIDDPAAPEPVDAAAPGRVGGGSLDVDEWLFLVRHDEDPERAAARCGVTLSAVEQAARRHSRIDVLTELQGARAAARRWRAETWAA